MLIYVDSGAGQSLCLSSSAFADMTPVPRAKSRLRAWRDLSRSMAAEPHCFSSKMNRVNLLSYECTIVYTGMDNSTFVFERLADLLRQTQLGGLQLGVSGSPSLNQFKEVTGTSTSLLGGRSVCNFGHSFPIG